MPRFLFAPVLVLVAGLVLAAQTPEASDEGPDVQRIGYGEAPEQIGELRLPAGEGPFPVVVLIHGGCWLERMGEGTLTPAAEALTRDGFATWSIGYRRLGHPDGGWPETFLDVGRAVDHLRVLAQTRPLDLWRVALVGHSSGAHLAVWAAGRSALPEASPVRGEDPLAATAAVGIDGPMDLAAWVGEREEQVCGEKVIGRLVGGPPTEVPERYAQVSPMEMPRIGAKVVLLPAALGPAGSEALARRAETTGDRVEVVPVESDHFQLIDPGHEAWKPVAEAVRRALGPGA